MRWADGFIAVDWGTTNRRAYLIDGSGRRTDEFEDHKGILSVPQGGFPEAIAEIRQRLGDKPLLLAGMVGSNRGWQEAPYVPCPAGIADLAGNLVWPGEREAIVPGVSYVGQGRADVMRGEEVQLLGGVASDMIAPDGFVCHPGTHNKWALLRHGTIQIFGTVMTGELFNLLKQHS
ncbi:MAG TPA: 2-dehydro-3-deoxygalactonokinase, partial [Sphingomicrobium sp.]|nr:2-dehydro-3-deoxygalactonokinase [Sphingomicrobium sp.]